MGVPKRQGRCVYTCNQTDAVGPDEAIRTGTRCLAAGVDPTRTGSFGCTRRTERSHRPKEPPAERTGGTAACPLGRSGGKQPANGVVTLPTQFSPPFRARRTGALGLQLAGKILGRGWPAELAVKGVGVGQMEGYAGHAATKAHARASQCAEAGYRRGGFQARVNCTHRFSFGWKMLGCD